MTWKKNEARCEYLYDKIQFKLDNCNKRLEQIELKLKELKKDFIMQLGCFMLCIAAVFFLLTIRPMIEDGFVSLLSSFLPFYDMILIIYTIVMIFVNIKSIAIKRKRLRFHTKFSDVLAYPAPITENLSSNAPISPKNLSDEKIMIEWLLERYWKELIELDMIRELIKKNQGEYDEEINKRLDGIIEYADVGRA